MYTLFVVLSILNSIALSIGVGSSTLAIVNYFVALADGSIDESERRMMGIVYVMLRISMVALLVTSGIIAFLYISAGDDYVMPYTVALWTLIAVLFANATLMTKKIMPSTVGPALQASTWYAMGVLVSLIPLQLADISYFNFLICYLAAIALSVTVVNAIMAWAKKRREVSTMQ